MWCASAPRNMLVCACRCVLAAAFIRERRSESGGFVRFGTFELECCEKSAFHTSNSTHLENARSACIGTMQRFCPMQNLQLHRAALASDADAVRSLLADKSLDVNERDESHQTPLMLAAC